MKQKVTRMKRLGVWGLTILIQIGTFGTEAAMADETKSPGILALEAEVAKVTLEKSLATLKKEIAEAELAEAKASLPTSQTKGQTGDVTFKDGAGYYAELLAYRSLGTASQKVAAATKDKIKDKTVVLTDQFDLGANDALWQLIDNKLGDFELRFASLLNKYKPGADGVIPVGTDQGGAVAALAITGILGAAADIAAYFRVNREFTGRAVTLSSRALLAEIAAAIQPNCAGVVIPSLKIGQKSQLATKLLSVQDQRRRAAETKQKIREQIKPSPSELERLTTEVKGAEQKLEKLKKDGAAATEIKKQEDLIDKLEGALAKERRKIELWTEVSGEFDPLITEFNALETTLTSRPTGQAASPLEAVAAVDTVRSLAAGAKVLYVAVVSQGAELQVTKTSFTSGRISYVGGSVVSYFLIDGPGGALEASGSLPNYETATFKGSVGASALGDSKP